MGCRIGAAPWVVTAMLGLAVEALAPPRAYAQEADSLRQLAERLATVERQLEELEREKVSPTSISGYMDFHYNDFQPGGEQLDFHRFVLLVAHEFSEDVRFYSELEVEHAFVKDGQGELELEQAFIDFHLDPDVAIRAGIVLVPIGIQNERHEGPAYFGVERHQVETVLIPTTWFEPGVGLFGRLAPGFDYKVYVLGSLDATKFSAGGIRGARSKGFFTNAASPAVAGRLIYRGTPGLTLGASIYRGDAGFDVPVSVVTTLYDVDAAYRYRFVELRGLWAQTFVGNARELSQAIGLPADAPVGERMQGFSVEAAVHLLPEAHPWDLALFARYEEADTQDRVPDGFTRAAQFDRDWTTVGASFLPHPDVVVKADYQFAGNDHSTIEAIDSFNLGLSWWF
ncbi:MAG TPA: porin [Gemmatimonadota bacterium]|nr:porin [Gemmatimonadota bacterium]